MFYQAAYLRKATHGRGLYGVLKYKDAAGKWRSKARLLAATTKRAAQRELDEWRVAMENDASKTASSRVLLGTYAEKAIADKEQAAAIMSVTAKDYRASMAGWSALRNVPLCDLTPDAIGDALRRMIADGISPNTALKRYIALKMVLEIAVQRGDLASSPMASVPRPQRVEPDKNPLDADTAARVKLLLQTIDPAPWTVAAQLCLLAGLRAEETAGLQLSDIDLASRRGYVRRAISYGKGGAQVAPPKGKRRRDFPISQTLADALRPWIAQQTASYGGAPDTWLLGNADRFADARDMGRKWSMFCDLCGIKGVAGKKPTLHDLRHTFATACVSAHMDIKTLQSILGHSSAAMTLDIYASADPAAKDGAADLIEAAI